MLNAIDAGTAMKVPQNGILSYVDDKEEVSIIFYDRALEESGYSTVQYSTVLLSKEVICIL